MARKSKEFLRRSLAAKKGWRTRRRNERARSQAAKKGWRTRKANERKIGKIAKRKRREFEEELFEEDFGIHVPEEFEPYDEISSLDYGEDDE